MIPIVGIWSYLVYGLLALLAYRALGAVLYVRQLRALPIRRGQIWLRDASEMPPYLHGLFVPADAELRALGFTPFGCQTVAGVFGSEQPRWCRVYLHSAARAYAVVTIAAPPEPEQPTTVEFTTYFADGQRLTTLNGLIHTILGRLPRTTLRDPYATTFAEHWQAHCAEVARLAAHGPALLLDPEQLCAAEQQLLDAYLLDLHRAGLTVPAADGGDRLRLLPAIRFMRQLERGAARLRALRRRRAALPAHRRPPPVTIPVEVEVAHFHSLADAPPRPAMPWRHKLILFLASLILFALSFSWIVPPRFLVALIGVLLLHELGHIAGMYLFGYSDLKMIFIPFFGAAALGSERNARAYQKVIVYFLGPAPGLILGLAGLLVYAATRAPAVRDWSIVALVVNYLNLLPLIPLDGGQILSAVLLGRAPLLQATFRLISGSVLLVAALVLGEPIMALVAVPLLLALPGEWRSGQALARLRRRVAQRSGADADQLLEVFGLLREPPYGRLPFAQKYQLAHALVRLSAAERPSARLTATTLAAYLALLALPLALMVYGS